ncbi:hypothetical protein RFI_30041 [Reticulomyxa filosa]|uniref:Uncharacterized protein n=1 Tax=Reticulomyxa filosa TaxID=46433 RepID=X6M0D7_RETFI|nr:hypothetical protein RFI_30041 [Reticulomyxa filosa]|eukprot:ETO07349.1 hypothetical protein RFI_30041 [Reticulomyxa filosa]
MKAFGERGQGEKKRNIIFEKNGKTPLWLITLFNNNALEFVSCDPNKCENEAIMPTSILIEMSVDNSDTKVSFYNEIVCDVDQCQQTKISIELVGATPTTSRMVHVENKIECQGSENRNDKTCQHMNISIETAPLANTSVGSSNSTLACIQSQCYDLTMTGVGTDLIIQDDRSHNINIFGALANSLLIVDNNIYIQIYIYIYIFYIYVQMYTLKKNKIIIME